MSKVVEGLLYSQSHEWVKVEGDVAFIGITDFAQEELGDITYVDFPELNEEIKAEQECGALESVKAASDLISPVSGEVVEVNEKLEDEPDLINEDPYGAWVLKLKLANKAELEELMDSDTYVKYTSK